MTPKTILVPTDLGEGADAALEYACDLAKSFGASIHLVSAITIPALGVPELGVAMTGSVVDGMMADTLHGLEALVERYKHCGTLARPILKSGDPVDIINETAAEVRADLIVMTTHGRTGVARWLLGSVAEQVVRTSTVPVLTIHVAAKRAAA
ncbi:MAG TPA: universal stress protein [Kofleriaceae bacterium]|nr:universal stress protein [Kofleriaceae bacterium]